MKNFLLKVCIPAFALFGLTGTAQAIIYDFTATDFTSYNGNTIPDTNISGSITIEGDIVSNIDLIIGAYTYSVADIGLADYNGTLSYAGGLSCGVTCLFIGPADAVVNDFTLLGNFSVDTPYFTQFKYTVEGLEDYFLTNTGTLTIRNEVPAPASAILLGLGLTAMGFGRRQKA